VMLSLPHATLNASAAHAIARPATPNADARPIVHCDVAYPPYPARDSFIGLTLMRVMRVMRVISVRVVFAVVLPLLAGCGSDKSSGVTPPGSNKTVDIFTIEQIFSPNLTTVAVGDTVRWNFNKASDGLGHNVRFNPRITGAPADIGTQANPLVSGTASRVFLSPGQYHYVCDLHGAMEGDIIVQ
ncbi:MAG: cupredoxin domain-containing protein, partial [Gemmatimonadaceae bacterium]